MGGDPGCAAASAGRAGGLPADKWPSLESLTSLNVAIAGGLGTDASVVSVICALFQAARLLVEERPGVINPVFPAFRPLLASTRGDWGAVGRQIENLTREHLIGIRDFVRMLADTLVLPYALASMKIASRLTCSECSNRLRTGKWL